MFLNFCFNTLNTGSRQQVRQFYLLLLCLLMSLGISRDCCHAAWTIASAGIEQASAPACHQVSYNSGIDSEHVQHDAAPNDPDDCCCVYRSPESAWQDHNLSSQGQFQAPQVQALRLTATPYAVLSTLHLQTNLQVPRGPPPVVGPAAFISQTILLI